MIIKTALLPFALSILVALPTQAATITGRVVKVSDGDTITVLEGTTQHKIRLMGIDAPEKAQPFGDKSKEALADSIAGKTVEVDYNRLDKYKRVIGKVLFRGQDMNLRQIELGMAWHYKQYEREQELEDRSNYAQAEYLAQRDKVGLWSYPQSMPPWEWRKSKKAERASRRNSEASHKVYPACAPTTNPPSLNPCPSPPAQRAKQR